MSSQAHLHISLGDNDHIECLAPEFNSLSSIHIKRNDDLYIDIDSLHLLLDNGMESNKLLVECSTQ